MVPTDDSVSRGSTPDPRFALHYARWALSILKLIPGALERSAVSLSDEEVRVRLHPGGEVHIPRNSITRVWRTRADEQGIFFRLPPVGGHSDLRGVWWMNRS